MQINYLSIDLPDVLKCALKTKAQAYLWTLDSFETDNKELISLCEEFYDESEVFLETVLDHVHARGSVYRIDYSFQDNDDFSKYFLKFKKSEQELIKKWNSVLDTK